MHNGNCRRKAGMMSEREDCESYIPSLDMYGRKQDGYYGFCSNRNIHERKEFSIYDHEVCWTLNPKFSPDGCGNCSNYIHKNIICQSFYLIKRILRTSGISQPAVWGYILEDLLNPSNDECNECNHTHKNCNTNTHQEGDGK